nr:MAG TPA: hypothetical protein [Caudoviricetes sp.]
MTNLPEPISRSDLYMAFLNGIGSIENLPIPRSRNDQYLYALCTQGLNPPVHSIEVQEGTLTLSKGNFFVEIQDNTEIVLPEVKEYAEIRLWFKVDNDLNITFPSNIAWQNEPETIGGYVYEYIFTHINNMWVGGYVSYEVGDNNA